MNKMTDKQAMDELEKRFEKAQQVLNNRDEFDVFMGRLENKLRTIPVVGNLLGDVSILVSLVKSYINKEYTSIPLGSIIAAISALIYFLSPVDFIPDVIPGAGYIDDLAVVAACWKLIKSDIDEFVLWREGQGCVF